MKTININEIIIPEEFINNPPNKKKVKVITEYYNKYNQLDKPIIIENYENKILCNNYIRYLVAREKDLKDIPCITIEEYKNNCPEINYICGIFNGNSKEYIWKNILNIDFNIGDKALVKSNNKKAVVTVTKVFKSNEPDLLKHKKCLKKLERKEKTYETDN